MNRQTLLCLSSGLQPRWRLDVLRLLAQAPGTLIQFRYSEGVLPETLRPAFQKNELHGAGALLCHVDCSSPTAKSGAACAITPCRYATLVRSTRIGAFFFLYFSLDEYARQPSAPIGESSVPNSPRWSGIDWVGDWCIYRPIDTASFGRTTDLAAWQETIERLSSKPDYRDEQVFFVVEGLYRIAPRWLGRTADSMRLSPTNAEFRLASDAEYELRVFHFSPNRHGATAASPDLDLRTEFSKPQVEAIAGGTSQPIDSPYDLKVIRFRTSREITGSKMASVTVTVSRASDSERLQTQPEVLVPIRVGSSRVREAGYILVIAVLLLWQKVTSVPTEVLSWQTVLLGLLALLTAGAVLRGIRRPV